jgi:HAD superfamily hydrolase (TIGR01509 family)
MSSSVARAVLWDMDGVLVDSADYHLQAWQEALGKEGVIVTPEDFQKTFGQRNDTILRTYFGKDFPETEIARVGDAKELIYRDLVRDHGIEPLPGALRWLKFLQQNGWKQAVASAAPRENVLTILDELDIAGFFGAITSSEDVTRGKPDPQVYVLAASRLGVVNSRCIVIEDAPAGIEGAARAGMKSIGVLSSHDDLSADLVVHSLAELDEKSFDQLRPA